MRGREKVWSIVIKVENSKSRGSSRRDHMLEAGRPFGDDGHMKTFPSESFP
jgi:hypothetical protein